MAERGLDRIHLDRLNMDRVNMAQGNRDVWYASNGFTKPYPGDSAVLLPDQVPGAGPVPPVVTTS